MLITLSTYILPHVGDIYSQCQDNLMYNLDNLSFAVADGVSQAYLSESFSKLLVDSFVKYPLDFFILDKDGHKRVNNEKYKVFEQWTSLRMKYEETLNENQQFMLKSRIKRGRDFAAATFAGLFIDDNKIAHISVLGDSCVFFISKKDNAMYSFSSMDMHDFGNSPDCFCSNGFMKGCLLEETIDLKDNDGIFLIMTDALSDWFYQAYKQKLDVCKELTSFKSHADFFKYIKALRSSSELKNDDTTMIIVDIEDSNKEDVIINEKNVDNKESLVLWANEFVGNAKRETLRLCEKLESKLALTEHDKAELQNNLEIITSNLKSANATNAELHKQLSQVTLDLKSANATNAELHKQLSQVTSDLKSANITNADLHKQLSQVASDFKSANATSVDLHKQLSQATSDLKVANATNADLQEQLKQVTSELESANAAKTDFHNQLNQVSSDLELVKKMNADLKEKLRVATNFDKKKVMDQLWFKQNVLFIIIVINMILNFLLVFKVYR